MRCNSEEDCTNLVKLLPPTEAALLDWAINLMADVVHYQHLNKMNARNIAMVFAPNMTQMADPLTALIHAVQVMNFLKTLILKTLQERDKSAAKENGGEREGSLEQTDEDACASTPLPSKSKFSRTSTLGRLEWCIEEKLWRSEETNGKGEFECGIGEGDSPPLSSRYENRYNSSNSGSGIYENEHWVRLRKGVRKLCRHPVFQLSKPTKKSANANLGVVNSSGNREQRGEAWA
ncbi:hypothetical protein PIB30_023747 [Stylosanthes scabra]|nr:hypothetical protein [Stylosanthes scabra]